MENLSLTDLIEEHIIKELQGVFVKKNGVESGIHMVDGTYLTSTCNVCDFCENMIKKTDEGRARCKACDYENAKKAFEEGRVSSYRCHAGLIDFSAPITVKGELFGFVVGGQVSLEPITREMSDQVAASFGIDQDAMYEASKQVRVVTQNNLDEAVSDADILARLLSKIATDKYQLMESSKEIEAAAKMKSNFLANMSHEIRTPMNAIIGMSDMALQESDASVVKSYIRQIKRSGAMLLGIINDILDFSKIESGKMDINMVTYSPNQIVEDIVHILQPRLKDKNVELVMDIDSNLPGELMGDDIRIRQIITNLANNAVKFTNEGQVKLTVRCEEKDAMTQNLHVEVSDTGIGIKKEDYAKIFESFQQVDSKRNRNIEGTGLGLAISKNLIELMEGKLSVESEYGVGSKFAFDIPQLELHKVEVEKVKNPDAIKALIYIKNTYASAQMEIDIQRLGCQVVVAHSKKECLEKLNDSTYLFIDKEYVDSDIYDELVRRGDTLNGAIIVGIDEGVSKKTENLKLVHSPVYSYRMIRLFNNEEFRPREDEDDNVVIDFIAPDARVLVVDDNEVNLSVCAGLLKPLNMQVETALSGKIAIEMITEKMYDLIFMDHMMPEIDGIETTHIIRRMYSNYDDVPIIALTANALENAKGMFLVEGMNDFMPKPIDFKELLRIVKTWLPPSKIISVDPETVASGDEGKIPVIEGIDVEAAIKMIGSLEVYNDLLKKFCGNANQKMEVIQSSYDHEDWDRYATEVHALKSSSRQIGAMDVGSLAEKMEFAGKNREVDAIRENTEELLKMYTALVEKLKEHVPKEEEELPRESIAADLVKDLLMTIIAAIDDLDAEIIKDTARKLSTGLFDEEKTKWSADLITAAENYDFDTCEDIANRWIGIL